jgi:hypothetical protein
VLARKEKNVKMLKRRRRRRRRRRRKANLTE